MAPATESGAFDRGRAASQVQRLIADASQRHDRQAAAIMLDAVAVLCWALDLRSSYLLGLVYQRCRSFPSLLSADATRALGPVVVEDLQRLAADLPLDDAISLALDVLDRCLAVGPSPEDIDSPGGEP